MMDTENLIAKLELALEEAKHKEIIATNNFNKLSKTMLEAPGGLLYCMHCGDGWAREDLKCPNCIEDYSALRKGNRDLNVSLNVALARARVEEETSDWFEAKTEYLSNALEEAAKWLKRLQETYDPEDREGSIAMIDGYMLLVSSKYPK